MRQSSITVKDVVRYLETHQMEEFQPLDPYACPVAQYANTRYQADKCSVGVCGVHLYRANGGQGSYLLRQEVRDFVAWFDRTYRYHVPGWGILAAWKEYTHVATALS